MPFLLLLSFLLLSKAVSAEPAITASTPADNGFAVHAVGSELQARATRIFVRVPDTLAAGARLPVLYVLPVEADDGKTPPAHGLQFLSRRHRWRTPVDAAARDSARLSRRPAPRPQLVERLAPGGGALARALGEAAQRRKVGAIAP